VIALSVHLAEAVILGVSAAAVHALPGETGGALIGWREGASVTVMDFIQIAPARAERSRYELTALCLNAALADYLSRESDTRRGYVGSWHTHPASTGPSIIDKHTFRKTARATPVHSRSSWPPRTAARPLSTPLGRAS